MHDLIGNTSGNMLNMKWAAFSSLSHIEARPEAAKNTPAGAGAAVENLTYTGHTEKYGACPRTNPPITTINT